MASDVSVLGLFMTKACVLTELVGEHIPFCFVGDGGLPVRVTRQKCQEVSPTLRGDGSVKITSQCVRMGSDESVPKTIHDAAFGCFV